MCPAKCLLYVQLKLPTSHPPKSLGSEASPLYDYHSSPTVFSNQRTGDKPLSDHVPSLNSQQHEGFWAWLSLTGRCP